MTWELSIEGDHLLSPQALVASWGIPTPRTVRANTAGTNNHSYVVETSAGTYFLRIYQNTADQERIGYEHALIGQLGSRSLSFAVPQPVPTVAGDTWLVQVNDRRVVAAAALFSAIAGQQPDASDLAQVAACGEALGELDHALSQITLADEYRGTPLFTDLGSVHSLVPDPVASSGRFPIPRKEHRRLRTLLQYLSTLTSDLYERLPRQVIHGDFDPSNVLVLDQRISGVLDFEFASHGPRAMDLAVGLWAFAISARGNRDPWPLVEAFASGYCRRAVLTSGEVRELPTLVLLREATSLVHWMGRLSQGLTTERDLARRADRLLGLEDWLCSHREELIQRVKASAHPLTRSVRKCWG